MVDVGAGAEVIVAALALIRPPVSSPPPPQPTAHNEDTTPATRIFPACNAEKKMEKRIRGGPGTKLNGLILPLDDGRNERLFKELQN